MQHLPDGVVFRYDYATSTVIGCYGHYLVEEFTFDVANRPRVKGRGRLAALRRYLYLSENGMEN